MASSLSFSSRLGSLQTSRVLPPRPQRPHRLNVSSKMPEAGMYGGPPDRKFRRMWGGERRKDPLETGDYLWDNKEEWARVLDKELKDASTPATAASSAASASEASAQAGRGSGFLSLGRSLALDSLDVDLSRELQPTRTVTLEDQVEAARLAAGERLRGWSSPQTPGGPAAEHAGAGIKWRSVNIPSARESRQQDKNKSFKPGSYSAYSPETEAEEERQFQQLKTNLLLYTVGLGSCFCASTALLYSPEVATSFALGSLGSLVYVRMLSTSVESLGGSGLGNAARGSLGQPRLLVPVVLVMAYNRWNAVLAPEYGLVELQLIPMLLGFLTYKAATIVQMFQEILVTAAGADSSASPNQGSDSN